MKIIIITGKIGTGKTTTSLILKNLGYDVFECDKVTKSLYLTSIIKTQIKEIFNAKINSLFLKNGQIDLIKLGNYVFKKKDQLKKLEELLHPLIINKKREFIKKSLFYKKKLIFLDVPLFFKTKVEYKYNYVINLFVNKNVQRSRVMSRYKMTKEKYKKIIALQSFKNSKLFQNNVININSGNGKHFVRKSIIKFIKSIK